MLRFGYALCSFFSWLGLLVSFLGSTAHAQAPSWQAPIVGSSSQTGGTSSARGTTVDASGNVFVTGSFTGRVAFGNTVLTSAGNNDLFVAKYVPSTATWAWAQRGGGAGNDYGQGIAVSGGNVYVTGYVFNSSADTQAVAFGGMDPGSSTQRLPGASRLESSDAVLAKYTDNGSSAVLGWTQVGGGTLTDISYGVAVSGSSVYITGSLTNTSANSSEAVFGGSNVGTGTSPQYGTASASSLDLFVAKYTDNGASATLGWTQVGGGRGSDMGYGIAASGANVYVTGAISNTKTNSTNVVFGGSGATAGAVLQYGASSGVARDLIVVKYTDQGSRATVNWTQVGGGTDQDFGNAIAVSGSNLYVAGTLTNTSTNGNTVLFGGSGASLGTVPQYGASTTASYDALVVKYTDNGSSATLGWTQVGGGTGSDLGYGIAASGSGVYMTGYISNTQANTNQVIFGGTGATAGTSTLLGSGTLVNSELLVTKYTDLGSNASLNWTQLGGGAFADFGAGVAVTSTGLFVAGYSNSNPATFGTASGAPLLGSADVRAVLTQLTDEGSAGTWQSVAAATNGGTSQTRAVATDARGNVFITGSFTGQVVFGSTVLTSAGGNDLFVAKYVPTTDTWAWAQRGGGLSNDQGYSIAVRETSVYVLGFLNNSTSNVNNVLFDNGTTSPVPVSGATSTASLDLVVAKYTDNGSSATLGWTQVGGGTDADYGYGITVSGPSVYITGAIFNNTSNANSVVFGGTGTTAGTVLVNGATSTASQDLLVAKYLDNGPSATLAWTQVGGGTTTDLGYGVAVSGTTVYVTGTIFNTASNAFGVVFGGTDTTPGTVPVYGASASATPDLVLAKYTDNGSSAALDWTQVGGGSNADYGFGVATNGPSVYVTGYLTNNSSNANSVVFGGTGTTAGTVPVQGATSTASQDLLVVKYTDNGSDASLKWAQVGGGTDSDVGYSVAVSGSNVYVTGVLNNSSTNANNAQFGDTGVGVLPVNGVSSTPTNDLLVAKYVDNGTAATLAWTQVGGGNRLDQGQGVAVSGQQVYVAGYVTPAASFGTYSLSNPDGYSLATIARLTDATLTPLPVELVTFTATASGSSAVSVAWATASETNSARFEVERSLDGRAFALIGSVVAAGNSTGLHSYRLTDAALPLEAHVYYYRLRQVDLDGRASYSPVRVVELTQRIALFPNPAHGGATLRGVAPTQLVQVYNVVGRLVFTATADGTGTAQLVLPVGLPSGLYTVRAGQQTLSLVVE